MTQPHPKDITVKALKVIVGVMLCLIIGAALSPGARGYCSGALRSVRSSWKVFAAVLGWFTVSLSIIFTNKHLLTDKGFEFPFSLSCATNAFVFFLVALATRPKALRPRPLPWPILIRVVLPIGVLTALDIGCSNWALVHLSVAFHTIIRGTVPAFVLIFSLLLRLDEPSWLIVASVFLVCAGCGLAAYSEVSMDVFGLLLALLSCVFSGLRWALTQLLVHRAPSKPSTPSGGGASGRGDGHAAAHAPPAAEPASPQAATPATRSRLAQDALDRNASPLSSMYYVTPACALASGVAALIMEAHDVGASPYVTTRRLRTELTWYVAAVGVLVFILLFCEFGLVRLTSSLSLAVFGVLKELLTIIMASHARGDSITPLNAAGFAMCACGVLLYQNVRAKTARGSEPTTPGSVRVGSRVRSSSGGGRGRATPRSSARRTRSPREAPLDGMDLAGGRSGEAAAAAGGAAAAAVGSCKLLSSGLSVTSPGRDDGRDEGEDLLSDDEHSGEEEEAAGHDDARPDSPASSWSTSALWSRLVGQNGHSEHEEADDHAEEDHHGATDSQEMGLLTRGNQ